MTEFYKVLGKNGDARMGVGTWYLPRGMRPGKWMPTIEGDLVPCCNGYHLARESDLLNWLGPRIFVAEYRGDVITADDKIVVRDARLIRETAWTDRAARLFAADCAERTLPIFEKNNPKDNRCRKAVEAARSFTNGQITRAELDAAGAAAWDAAGAAARAAVGNAAWAASWAAAGAAARDAAWVAARDAAGAAAGDAARDAERQWQTDRLFQYLNGEVP